MKPGFWIFMCFISLSCQLFSQYTWRNRACIPGSGRTGVAAFSIGNKGYVVGGTTQATLALSDVWEYDPSTNIWTQKNNFPVARGGMAVFVINGTAYVGIGNDVSYGYHTDFYKYNAATDQWTPIASFPGDPRYLGMTFVLNGKGYLGCGFNGNLYDDFYQYDPTTNTWTQRANFPGGARQTGFGASVGGYGFMGLGWDANNPLGDLYRYNDTTNVWTQVANFGGPARVAPGCFVLNDTLYLAGGRQEPAPLYTDCWQYKVGSDSWIQEQGFACYSLPVATTYGFVADGHGYITCGGYGVTFSNQLLEFGPLDGAFVTRVHILGSDTSYCNNFSRVLSTGNSCTLWSTGVTALQITVTTPGTYWAYWPDSCGMVSDTIYITQGAPAPFSLGNDTSYCGNFSRILSTGDAATVWSTGISASQITVSAPGTYWATVSTACGTASDTISITQKPAPVVNLGDDTSLCTGETLLLDAANPNSTYLWQDNSTNSTYTVFSAGTYSVTVTNNSGCSATGAIVVTLGVPQFSLGNDTNVCSSAGITLNIPLPDAQFHWQDNSTDSFYHVLTSGTYSVTVTNNCGAAYGRVTIDVHTDDCRLNLPTAFSPNGDGKNDYFHALCQCPVKNFSMRIYNRWGETVYQTQNFADGWDGTYQGIPQPLGVFVYLIQYFNDCENRMKTITGNFTLLR